MSRVRTIATFVIIAFGCLLVGLPINAQNKSKIQTQNRSEYYSREQIDAKFHELYENIINGTMSKKELTDRFNELEKKIGALPGSGTINTLKKQIDVNQNSDEGRLNQLSGQIKAIANRISSAPWWLSSAISGLALVASIIIPFVILSRGQSTKNKERSEDQEARKRERAEDKAWTLIRDWDTSSSRIAEVLGDLNEPENLADPNRRNALRDIGNLYDLIAQCWKDGSANKDMLEQRGLRKAARDFWSALLKADETLKKSTDPSPPASLGDEIAAWPGIAWLMT